MNVILTSHYVVAYSSGLLSHFNLHKHFLWNEVREGQGMEKNLYMLKITGKD